MSLDRFHKAQKGHSGYSQAKIEIQNGRKTSHWIWYIFPQLKSLGYSENAKFYGISDLNEACEYLKDPVLFKRYHQMVQLVEQQLQRIPLVTLMGGDTDAKKLMSSLTLFRQATSHLNSLQGKNNHDIKDLEQRCTHILKISANQNYQPCHKTLSILSHSAKPSAPQKTGTPEVPGSFFKEKKTPTDKAQVNTPRPNSSIIKELTRYQNIRKNEWGFHYNFLGIISALYFIQDMLSGTDHFNSKSREIKISAASKLEQLMTPSHAGPITFSESEKKALKDGRLGAIVSKHGGLEQLMNASSMKQANPASSSTDFQL
jgi:uncharacterized protein (DUF1810 family)